jgi:hypothetical protein
MPYDHLIELIGFVEQARRSQIPDAKKRFAARVKKNTRDYPGTSGQRRVAARKGTKTKYRNPNESRQKH